MPVKIREISGALIKRELVRKPETILTPVQMGINKAIDQIGFRSIGLNREKLAVTIFQSDCSFEPVPWETATFTTKERYYKRADAIIAREHEILEVTNEGN